MDFVKLGVIKSDENLAANQIKFIPTNRNFETIKNIKGFYIIGLQYLLIFKDGKIYTIRNLQ